MGTGKEVSPYCYLPFGILEQSHLLYMVFLVMLPTISVSILKMLPPYPLMCANVQTWPKLEHISTSGGERGAC